MTLKRYAVQSLLYRSRLILLLNLVIMMLSSGLAAGAQLEQSYIYNFWAEAVPAPQAYTVSHLINGNDLGIGKFNNPQDLGVSKNNRLYIVDSGNDRIICLDQNFELVKVIDQITNKGKKERFNNPQGIFVADNDTIYVADSEHGRIVQIDQNGELIGELRAPKTDLSIAAADFEFIPLKVNVDPTGRIFVIAKNVYEGLLEYDLAGNFKGFIGAPRVTPGVLDYFWRRFATEEQREQQALFLPTEFSNIAIGHDGFIYTTVANTSAMWSDVIRKLNPAGKDILIRAGFFKPVGDIIYYTGPSRFVDITVRQYGVYSVLDQARGRVFTYDQNGNLLYIFGGPGGSIEGTFTTPTALTHLQEKLLVLDASSGELTVFRPTQYTKYIHNALMYYNAGDFNNSTAMWEKVIEANANFELAYSGIGRDLFRKNQYQAAMEYFRYGNNRLEYSKAFRFYRKGFIEDNFLLIFIVIIVSGLLFLLAQKYKLKRVLFSKIGQVLPKLPVKASVFKETFNGLRYSLHLIFHPFDGFWDLKHEKRGNLPTAMIILFGLTITYILMRQYTGFIFNFNQAAEINLLFEILSVIIPFMLWCLINWSVTTLMDGKGTMKDIIIATAYAVIPLIIITIPLTLISNYLILEEGAFYNLFLNTAVIWTILLLFLSILVTHQYDIPKTILVSLIIIIGIVAAIFLGMLFFSVINTLIAFLSTLYKELNFRL